MAKKKKSFAEIKKEAISKRQASYPKISIITPSLNQGQFLEECIDSILSQDYPNLEYIIMDGGSTDNSIEIIKKYEKYLTYWQSQPDNGHYAAINEGFKKTTGEIMGWLNSDDKFHPHGLSVLGEVFSRFPQVDFLTGRRIGFDASGNLRLFPYDGETWNRNTLLDENSLITERLIMQEATYWRRKLWDKAGGTLDLSYKFAADFELWLRFLRFTQLYTVDARVAGFRYHGPQQRSQVFRRDYNAECKKALDREKNVTSENPHLDGVAPVLISYPITKHDEISINIVPPEVPIVTTSLNSDKSLRPAPLPISEQSPYDTTNSKEFVDMDKVMGYISQADAHVANGDLASAREAIKEALRYAVRNPQLSGMLRNILMTIESR